MIVGVKKVRRPTTMTYFLYSSPGIQSAPASRPSSRSRVPQIAMYNSSAGFLQTTP